MKIIFEIRTDAGDSIHRITADIQPTDLANMNNFIISIAKPALYRLRRELNVEPTEMK